MDEKILVLEKAGATREAGARVIAEAMVATKMTVDKFGEEHIEADHAMRLRAEELRAKESGDIKMEVNVDNRVVNISASSDEVKILLGVVMDVQGQLGRLRVEGHQTGEIISARGGDIIDIS